MYWIAVGCIALGLIIEACLFMHEARADMIIVDPTSGIKGIIITPPPPPTWS